jgi:inner membrane protein
LWIYLFLATASHGFLDAMTDGGLGVAFFSPFSNKRYFLPWTPIRVSPIGAGRFFSSRGLDVLRTEFLWIWLPAAVLVMAAWILWHRSPQVES